MKNRLKLFLSVNILLIITWIVYLFWVQIFDPHDFNKIVELRQHPSKDIIIPKRGNIYDCNKELLVGTNKSYQIDFDRTSIVNKFNETKLKEKIEKISNILCNNSSLSKEYIDKILNKKPLKSSIYISESFSESQVIKIKEAFIEEEISGLMISFNKIHRTYPRNKLGANFLGIIEESISDQEQGVSESIYNVHGVCGLEASFNNELSGSNGWRETIEDANNNRIPFLFLRQNDAVNGNSMVLTIDNKLQEILEERLKIGLKEYQAKNAIGIIMDPSTGKIIAMSGIAKNKLNSSAKVLRSSSNMPVSFMFEPGSTLKPITALLALDNNIFKPEDVVDCTDYHLTFGEEKRTIKDDHKYQKLSFKDIIAYSSNVGISKIVEKIGQEKLYERLIALGFRHRIGYNIAGESAGIFRKLSDWQGYSLHSISFGQEISVTALQLANAYCALANGGKVMQPYFVDRLIDDDNNIVTQFKPKVLRKISDTQSLNTLKYFMKSVVDYGTATLAKIDFLDVAGKTGTAEKVISGTTVYSEEKYTSVFAGFFPVEKPKYVIVIVYDEADFKSYSYYASLSAVPTFKQIILDIVNLPESHVVSAVKEEKIEFIHAPDLIGLTRNKAIDLLNSKKIKYQLMEDDNSNIITDQFPKPNISYNKNENMLVILKNNVTKIDSINNDFNNKMPNLVGLTIRKAITRSYHNCIKLCIQGNGKIISQSIKPGTKIQFGAQCTVKANL